MSTRANIIFRDADSELIFYRHSDGYPEVTGEDLKTFVQGYKSTLRNNVMQSAGWLIVQGYLDPSYKKYRAGGVGMGWKVGAYEPTNQLHGDVEYIYTIDLVNGVLATHVTLPEFWDKPTLENTKRVDSTSFEVA